MSSDLEPAAPKHGIEFQRKTTRGKKGEGGLYQKVINGKLMWQATKDVARPDGKRRQISGSGSTPMEAMTRLAANLARNIEKPKKTRERKPSHGITVEAWVRQWHKTLDPNRTSDTTRYKYLRTLERHVLPHIGLMPLGNLTDADCQKLFAITLASKTNPDGSPLLSPDGLRNVHIPLSKCLNTATKLDLIPKNPLASVTLPNRQRKDESIHQRTHQALGLMKRLEENPEIEARYLLQFLGLRQSERLGLEWSSIRNLNSKTQPCILVVQAQLERRVDGSGYWLKPEPKTKAGFREIPVPDPFLSALRRWQKLQKQWAKSREWQPLPWQEKLVFTTRQGGHIYHQKDTDGWKHLLETYGYPSDWRGHLNRHITATMLAAMDPPLPMELVIQILGQNSTAMGRYYAAFNAKSMVKPMNAYGDYISQGKIQKGVRGGGTEPSEDDNLE